MPLSPWLCPLHTFMPTQIYSQFQCLNNPLNPTSAACEVIDGSRWLDLIQVLCRQPWLPWVHEFKAMSWSKDWFRALLHVLLHSYHSFFCDFPEPCRAGDLMWMSHLGKTYGLFMVTHSDQAQASASAADCHRLKLLWLKSRAALIYSPVLP